MPTASDLPLAGICVVITRPVGTGRALARRVRTLGGQPLLLPGSSLRAIDDAGAARRALGEALRCDGVVFTSPAAVRFGRRLAPLHTRAPVLAPGAGTARALRRAGARRVACPAREDSEGMLALPELYAVRGRRIGIVGAAGGRGLLERELAARGATPVCAYVYRRLPPRLDRRHAEALLRTRQQPLFVLLTSVQALEHILSALPGDARRALLSGTAVVSSGRLQGLARSAGFARTLRATSAHAEALLAAIMQRRG